VTRGGGFHPSQGDASAKNAMGNADRTCSTRAYGQFSSSFFFSMKVFRTQKGVVPEVTMTINVKDAWTVIRNLVFGQDNNGSGPIRLRCEDW
jgi:hypothetical protein